MLSLAWVNINIHLAGVLTYNHALVYSLTRRDKHSTTVLQGENTITSGLTLLKCYQGTTSTAWNIPLIRHITSKGMVHNTVTFGIGQKLRTETNQATSRNQEFHAHIARNLSHIGQLCLASTQRHHNSTLILLWNLNSQILHRLTLLTINGLVYNLWLTNLQFIAFTTHSLNQNGQMQLTTARNLEYISTISFLYTERYIGLNFLEKTIAEMTGSNKLSLATSKRTGIYTKGHGQSWLININSWQCLWIFCIGNSITNANIAQTSQANNLTHGSLWNLYTAQALISIYLANLGLSLAVTI